MMRDMQLFAGKTEIRYRNHEYGKRGLLIKADVYLWDVLHL